MAVWEIYLNFLKIYFDLYSVQAVFWNYLSNIIVFTVLQIDLRVMI